MTDTAAGDYNAGGLPVTYRAWGNVLRVEVPQPLPVRSVKTVPQAYAEQDEIAQPLRFQGQYYDSETGLHYNRFRYYDPDCGRFVSQDPIGLNGGNNLYQYAPNPSGWVDPLGLACWQDKFRKRSKEEVEKLRKEFDSKSKPEFLRSLAKDPGAEERFSTEQLSQLQKGKLPEGMVVHHKTPLFRGGTNENSNFDLVSESEHRKRNKELHYYEEGKNPYGC